MIVRALSVLMPRGTTELAGLLGCPLAASSLHPSSWECKFVTLRDSACTALRNLYFTGFAWVGTVDFLHVASIQ